MRTLLLRIASAVLCVCAITPSYAGMFDDDEARQALLNLREKTKTFQEETANRFEQNSRAMLDLQSQLTQLKDDSARLRGQNEALRNDLTQAQSALAEQKTRYQELDARLKKLEPQRVVVEGVEGLVGPMETGAYDAALKSFRDNEPKVAVGDFRDFLKRYPNSVYVPLAQFWMGNGLYAQRDYKSAMSILQAMIKAFPTHPKVPDAWAVVGSCQSESGQKQHARKTFEMIVQSYPGTPAAILAQQRLMSLK